MKNTIDLDQSSQRPDSRILQFRASLQPAVVFLACPVRASLDVLGRKWSLLILYSLGFMRINRFNEMRAYMPEITGSVLAKRLRQLEKTDYVKRKMERNASSIAVIWELTEKGRDTVPIIMSLIAHSSRWNARDLFEGGMPKNLQQIFPRQVRGDQGSRRPPVGFVSCQRGARLSKRCLGLFSEYRPSSLVLGCLQGGVISSAPTFPQLTHVSQGRTFSAYADSFSYQWER